MATTTRVLTASVNGTVYTANANGALEAIDTCHSGATAPTNEVANGKLWLDTTTTPGILKMFNNATWEVVLTATSGALMDSELTNIAAVKALDQGVSTTNGPTFAGVNVVGNISVGASGAEGGHIDLRNPDGTSVGGNLDVAGANQLRLFQVADNSAMEIGQLVGTGGRVTFHTAGAERMRIDGSGNVGVGTDSPGGPLDVVNDTQRYMFRNGTIDCVNSTNSAWGTFVAQGAEVELRTADGVKQLKMLSNGKIGIGKENPATPLDVNGTVTATAFAGDGSALTGLSGGQTYDIQTFTTSGTWTRPTGYLSTDEVWVWVVGGGGGGGKDSDPRQAVGGNGGVGLYKRFDADLLGTTVPVTVGAGGGAASDGGNSSFGTSGTYGYIRGEGGENGVSNDGSTGYQYAVMYDTSAGANKSIRLLKTQNPYYGLAIDGGNAQVEGSTGMTDIPATIYGGGAGASLAGSGGLSLYGGHGGGANKNNAATGNGSFPGGGGGSNDSDNGNGGDGAAGIVVVYTKRTVL